MTRTISADPVAGGGIVRVFMQVLGTRGDVELFLLLGRALARRGHDVVLGSSPFYEAMANAAGLGWQALGTGSQTELVSIMRALAEIPDQRQRVQRYVDRWLRPQLAAAMPAVRDALARADYVVNNLKTVWKKSAAVMPGATVIYDPPSSGTRAAQFAPQRVDHAGAVLELVAMNRDLVDPGREWPASYRFTGFWHPPVPMGGPPDPRLTEFVQQAPPPMVLTLGSMVMLDAPALVCKLSAALRDTGQRAVVIAGWAELGGERDGDERMFLAPEVPYGWLFPRASAVIHHGGCGTVAATLKAGRPSILLPRIGSQENFARLLTDGGVVAAVLDADSVSVEALGQAIRAAVGDERLRENALEWSRRIAADRGVDEAVDAIEAHATRFVEPRGVPG